MFGGRVDGRGAADRAGRRTVMGPCMCGDIQCSSCGPAQGNFRCPICRVWADDGCEHIGEDLKVKPEYQNDNNEEAYQFGQEDNEDKV